MPSFEQDHQYLLELSNIFKPTSQYSLDYTFSAIDEEIANYKLWEKFFHGPIPLKKKQLTPTSTDTNSAKSAIIPLKTKKPSIQDTFQAYTKMTTSSDFNMLCLEAPRDLLQITDVRPLPEQAMEMSNPAVWVRTMVRQQR